MTGKQIDDEIFDRKAEKLINDNSDMPYLKNYKNWLKPNHTRRTVYNYLLYVIQFLRYVDKPIEVISLDDYTDYADKQSKCSSSNQIAKYSAIKAFAKYLKAARRINDNFMAEANRPKFIETQEAKEKREKNIVTPKEIQQILRNVEIGVGNERALWFQEPYRARDMSIMMLFLTTGIRITALRNMNIEDVDFENNLIRVTEKGEKATIHNIPEETAIVIKKWLIQREAILKRNDREEEKALFVSNQHNRLCDTGVREIVSKYTRSLTGKKITPHKLRATYGTLLYDRTHDIELVRQQLNHRSIITTQKYIRGTEEANRKKSAEIMSSLVSSTKRRNTSSLFESESEE